MIITIYELIGLIKDGKAPNKIWYDDEFWNYDKKDNDYSKYGNILLFDRYIRDDFFTHLNDTVEIIEDECGWTSLDEIEECNFNKDLSENFTEETPNYNLMNLIEDSITKNRKMINLLIKNQKCLKERLDKNE